MADLAQRHLAECAHETLLPFGRQRLPDPTGRPLAHRVIQASVRARVALRGRVSGIRRTLSNYQRCLLWGIERLINRLKQARRIATRYEKRAENYLGMIHIGMILLWLKPFADTA